MRKIKGRLEGLIDRINAMDEQISMLNNMERKYENWKEKKEKTERINL